MLQSVSSPTIRQAKSPFSERVSHNASPAPAAKEDTVEAQAPAPRRSFLRRFGAPLLMGATLLGASTLAPSVASAHDNFGAAIVGGIIGGVVGGAIANSMPPPVYVVPPPVYYVNPGINAVGCDGIVHHFDGRGNVADNSGYYRLFINGWGQCQAGRPW